MILNTFFKSLTRKKVINDSGSELARVLNLLDLTALGVGSTLGLGVYILAGSVAKQLAGPAVCISFLVAAIASAVAGLCYAEFAARVPKAGSAYVYSYVSVGEFVAFVIGWNLILEYGLGTASVAKALSSYIDVLTDKKIENEQSTWIVMNVNFLSPYVDFLSFSFVALLTGLLCIGVKESTRLNNILTGLNLLTIMVMFVSGVINANPDNWNIPKESIPKNYTEAGEGGFAPFGVSGIMAGAAKCFFGFVGFDAVATTGEEAINPQRNIPLSIMICLVVVFLAYFGISSVLTMMWPYYLQDENAPFPHVFEEIGWDTIKLIVTVGAIFALFTSLLGAMFPLPRVIYAMSNDGLLFKFLEKVNKKSQTPILATCVSGLIAGLMAALFDLQQLIDMMSIGTLMAYTIVAVCVLLLRYKPDEHSDYLAQLEKKPDLEVDRVIFSFFKLLFNLNGNKYPDNTTSLVTNYSIAVFSVLSFGLDAFAIYGLDALSKPYYLVIFVIIILLMISLIVVIARQPVNPAELSFKVPLVPLIPLLSIVINLYLMLELSGDTWKNFSIWLALGFLIYFLYGIRQSRQKVGYTKKSATDSIKEKDATDSSSNNQEVTRF